MLQVTLMSLKDSRIKMMSDVLDGIMVLVVYRYFVAMQLYRAVRFMFTEGAVFLNSQQTSL